MQFQTKKALRYVAFVAWLCFVTSLFLPAIGGPGDAMYGWQAFVSVIEECSGLFRWPAGRISDSTWLAYPPANIFALLLPLVLWKRPRWAAFFGWPILFGGIVALIRLGLFDNDMRVGYYLWVASLLALGGLCLLHSGGKFWRAFEFEG